MYRNCNIWGLLMAMKNGLATMEPSMVTPQKIKNGIAIIIQQSQKN